ncbi:MAG: imidazole glycerol phosphate synthase subunit HisF [Candidatus Obscuribacterales bacterium]|nr:imidazole glycerol phosphate synthase subunit HisF [Candidatus Obscuribacterales bacterium]
MNFGYNSQEIGAGLCKRIIPCLDVKNGRTVKGVKFQGLIEAGDPVEQSLAYELQGADEIMLLDITASVEGRATTLTLVKEVARQLSIPLTVGGGITNVRDVEALLAAGADKVSMNTAAVVNPELVRDVAESFGSQCCVVAIDARLNAGSEGWNVLIRGGRDDSGRDALDWARECVELGAGEILLTSWDLDGTRSGFDLPLTRAFAELPVPIIASGGASSPACFLDVFSSGGADAALAASIFHFGEYTVGDVKEVLTSNGVKVRI